VPVVFEKSVTCRFHVSLCRTRIEAGFTFDPIQEMAMPTAVPEKGLGFMQEGTSGGSVTPRDCIANPCRELQ
jgi:hypothetical protein